MPKITSISLSLSMPVPYWGEQAYTPSAKPHFGATASIEEDEDPNKATRKLYRWVLWHFLKTAQAAHGTHCKVRDDFDDHAEKYFEQHPKPPQLSI